jgi:hypothetical protein
MKKKMEKCHKCKEYIYIIAGTPYCGCKDIDINKKENER